MLQKALCVVATATGSLSASAYSGKHRSSRPPQAVRCWMECVTQVIEPQGGSTTHPDPGDRRRGQHLNRATLHLHCPHRQRRICRQAATAARFRDLIARRGPSFTNRDGGDCGPMRLGVCDYLAETTRLLEPVATGCPARRLRRPGRRGYVSGGRRETRHGARADAKLLATTAAVGHLRSQRQRCTRLPIASPLRKWLPGLN